MVIGKYTDVFRRAFFGGGIFYEDNLPLGEIVWKKMVNVMGTHKDKSVGLLWILIEEVIRKGLRELETWLEKVTSKGLNSVASMGSSLYYALLASNCFVLRSVVVVTNKNILRYTVK